MAVDEATKKRVDNWIKSENRNVFGDPQGTQYLGATPLFNSMTGLSKDRYEYILEKNPQLRDGAQGAGS